MLEHLRELKRRLMAIAAAIIVGSLLAYGFEQRIVALLIKPSHGQHFIYTSPLGGMNFLFSLCFDIGLLIATPVIIYHLLAFIQPLMPQSSRRFLLSVSVVATITAACGVIFGYLVGLPSALHFLLNQFDVLQVKPLLTIQSYVSFVALYLLGSALMFQVPLILVIINRITPLKPRKLVHYERHVIVTALVAAFIMNPTPNLLTQLIVVGPIVCMYQVGIVVIWLANRRSEVMLSSTPADLTPQTA